MTISATDILVPVCSKMPLLYLLTQKVAQKFGYVLGIEETDQGLVSDVCIKRKVRNYIHLLKGLKTPYDIFIREGNILNPLIQEKRDEADKTNNEEKKAVKSGRQAMCAQYFDIRTFGAVMSTGEEKDEEEDTEEKGKNKKANSKKIKGLGVVRGPVQFTFALSLIHI